MKQIKQNKNIVKLQKNLINLLFYKNMKIDWFYYFTVQIKQKTSTRQQDDEPENREF
jgi:hypothetical protein